MNNNPGPGSYDQVPLKSGPKYHMAGKLDCTSNIGVTERQSRGIPGPGTYQPKNDAVMKSDGAFTMK
jgi:hypothetical protein